MWAREAASTKNTARKCNGGMAAAGGSLFASCEQTRDPLAGAEGSEVAWLSVAPFM